MAYVKNIWVDQDVERPKTYEVTNNQDGSITLTDSFGLVTELGTPVNEVNMNHIEEGIAGCAIRKHNLTETFNLGEWVLGGTGDDEGIYKSLIANNVGNAITDDTKWEKVEMGGGSSRNIGEIVTSTIPLTDAGLHLLDGTLINGNGSYADFVEYIGDLYDTGDYPDLFCSEADWQTSVTNYGVCGKFVYDSVNNTVRLPKYSNKIYTKDIASTAAVKGNGLALGVTDNTNTGYLINPNAHYENGFRLYSDTQPTAGDSVSFTGGDWLIQNAYIGITTDSTKSGIIADLANITTSLDGYYYIVVATSTKTDIEVDIDEIATDLSGKMDTDGTNAVSSVKFADGQWVESNSTIASSVTISYNAIKSYNLSNYLPNDGYNYEVLFGLSGQSGSSSGNTICAYIGSDFVSYNGYMPIAYSATRASGSAYGGGNAIIPIGLSRIVKIWSSSSANFTFNLFAAAYRRVGTNQ